MTRHPQLATSSADVISRSRQEAVHRPQGRCIVRASSRTRARTPCGGRPPLLPRPPSPPPRETPQRARTAPRRGGGGGAWPARSGARSAGPGCGRRAPASLPPLSARPPRGRMSLGRVNGGSVGFAHSQSRPTTQGRLHLWPLWPLVGLLSGRGSLGRVGGGGSVPRARTRALLRKGRLRPRPLVGRLRGCSSLGRVQEPRAAAETRFRAAHSRGRPTRRAPAPAPPWASPREARAGRGRRRRRRRGWAPPRAPR
mmetsp:Transcript_38389/g.83507  ORF Transcript_38389/g.83507 Transcript_38389/m.83507 type:complete len:255 (+) Transcript_38389:503-1267(+)